MKWNTWERLKNLLQQINKLQQINLEFILFTGWHSSITLGKQFRDYNCKLFFSLAGVEKRGGCAISQKDLSFFQNAHEAHGLLMFTGRQRKCTRGWKLPWKALPCCSEPSILMPFGNLVQEIFPSALMCPLSDSSGQRRSDLEAPPFNMINADLNIN